MHGKFTHVEPKSCHETDTLSWLKWLYATPKDRIWGLHLTGAGMTCVAPEETYFMGDEGRRTENYAIVYVADGEGIYRSNEINEATLAAGDVFMFFPSVWHRYRPNPETGWREFWVEFSGYCPDRLLDQGVISPRNPVLHLDSDTHVKELFIDLLDAISQQQAPAHPALSSILFEILTDVVARSGASTEDGVWKHADIVRAKSYLQENVHRNVPVSELADTLSMSPRNLHYAFKEATGISPHQYQMRARIALAKGLLAEPTLMIKEVAKNLGFLDAYYFSRIFKRQVGMSPEEWRATQRANRND